MGTHNVAGFTVGFLLHGIERLSPQLVVAHYAGETLHVEDLVHGCAASAFSNNVLPAAGTASCHQGKGQQSKQGRCPSCRGHPSTHPWLHGRPGGRGSPVHRKNNLCHCWQRSSSSPIHNLAQRSSATGRHSGAGPYEKI